MLAWALAGCGENAEHGEGATGGAPSLGGTGGTLATGGVTASGGATTGPSGGAPSGGAPATGGVPGTGGAGGGTGGSGETGGSGSGGIAATGGSSSSTGGASAGSGGASSEPVKMSAGCGKQGRPTGGKVTVAGDHIYTFPEGYDGTKPFPLFVGFHACGNPIDQFLNLTKGSRFETEFVRAFPRSSDSGGCWNYGNDIGRVTRVYDELMASHCIDTNRVFAAGHSSGAQMIVQILTHAADAAHVKFKAVSPVAASDYGALSGPEPVLYIQGTKDTVRGNDGATAVARFRAANACSASSTRYSGILGCQSSGKAVNPGCIAYDDCEAPTIWCSHDDPQYGGTSHGVPCFAITAMYDFFTGVR